MGARQLRHLPLLRRSVSRKGGSRGFFLVLAFLAIAALAVAGATASAAGAASAAISGSLGPAAPHLQALAAGGPLSVAGGALDSYVVEPDGTLWSFGGNVYGELGSGDVTPHSVPTQVGTDSDWSQVATGPSGSLVVAIKQNGTLWQWGDNEQYYLGNSPTLTLVPTEVGTDTDWTHVAVGHDYVIALKSAGTLWAMGDGDYGVLGLGDDSAALTFQQVGSDTDWASVACGMYHTAAIKQNGTLWTWGHNDCGQLGYSTSPAVEWDVPRQVGSATDWLSVACGSSHTLAITGAGALWAWGDNYAGQIGQGDAANLGGTVRYGAPVRVGADSDWVMADGGEWHSIALKSNGTLWGWGDNGYGQLGVGLQSHIIGQSDTTTPTQIDPGTDWSTVTCGALFSLAAKAADGSFFAWGDNGYGQIGVGYPLARCTPAQIGSDPGWTSVATADRNAIATRSDGTLWNWYGFSRTPAQLGTARDWQAAFAADRYFFALKTDGTLWSWGGADGNSAGELGLGDTDARDTPTQVGTAGDWTTVACSSAGFGVGHTLALKADGSLWAWGSNTNGELGLSAKDSNSHATPARVGTATDWRSIIAGPHCSFAIKTDGTLWAWGRDSDGRIGLGSDTSDRSVPTQVGTDNDWKMVSSGSAADTGYTLAVKTDGTMWAWGDNGGLQLGLGNNVSPRLAPAQVGTDTDWSQVAVGDEYAVAIKTDGSLWAWGQNGSGDLGIGNYRWQDIPTPAGAGTDWSSVTCLDDSYALKTDGTLWAWGANDESQLGLGDPLWHPQPVDLVLTTLPDITVPTINAIPGLLSLGSGVATVTARATAADAAPLGSAAAGWYRAPVKVRFSAADGGWGIARTQYSLNGAIGWLTEDSVTISSNGTKTVTYEAVDRAGNPSAMHTITVHVDRVKPVPKALKAISVRRGRRFTFQLRVTDKWSPTCAVKIVIKKGVHKVKTLQLGQLKTGATRRHVLRCTLRAGSYRWYVYATDLAGNGQSKVSSNKLTVK